MTLVFMRLATSSQPYVVTIHKRIKLIHCVYEQASTKRANILEEFR